jgi:hypothetical protein
MARATIKVYSQVILVLTEQESNYLRGLLQNPLTIGEAEEDSELRRAIFAELPFLSTLES